MKAGPQHILNICADTLSVLESTRKWLKAKILEIILGCNLATNPDYAIYITKPQIYEQQHVMTPISINIFEYSLVYYTVRLEDFHNFLGFIFFCLKIVDAFIGIPEVEYWTLFWLKPRALICQNSMCDFHSAKNSKLQKKMPPSNQKN